ncbi:pyruvate carboxylase Pyr1 [Schizosaccharomyces pombe]|uniref:Pyruvate carboxylase n=1 Tax=Schizosaccharomyces pombe (strain 972 / ATCC 24843) TaxID=284812 RepID=PYC_SCHPO|nr:pyruvate carboxylase Pyr1 [Schizosaccharomyces pombe]Q9UUE1.1 RecName: Full=Pyruvate carboxylase; AltName: Full=Pyruvic carboxylase; Short=PCB [Schizosaccharomyces pombe 972h-]CAB52809.1 pyruvate carboxylase Pyr1 [Schizosaccharomyces pombe]|eukprot:NP_595900.1 pyruvate carboxylase Pyr1 [Schizosaccharomyces pombe]
MTSKYDALLHNQSTNTNPFSKLQDRSSLLGEKFTKVLVANRSEIAIRVFRTAHELSMHTVAIYSYEDRLSMHRQKADESYPIGKVGQYSPVGAYLAIDEIVSIAKRTGANLVHPGYGFLSENAEFARKVNEAGMQFVGPSPEVIDSLGDKTKARAIAIRCGVPVVPGTPGPVEHYEEAEAFVKEYGLPVIIKAAMGGGGRGMRVVRSADTLKESFERARSEALASFGDGTVFIERFLDKPKHIEIQLMADKAGNVIHLHERDCSVQRRHQKVVEIAPAKDLDPKIRQALYDDAIKIAKEVKYCNAGTAEFLLDQKGRHYFIEINPRIQVEHTITEEITGVDIVSAQLHVAAGFTLPEIGLTQDKISTRGFAIQCRVTTEDPNNGFAPDIGKIEVYRSAGGNGVRLDGANGFAGSVITPHYDSMLVKCTCHDATYEYTRRKMIRSLIEFRVRGVKTNIPFVLRLLMHDTFIQGNCWTTFIDDTPELFQLYRSRNRAQKLLAYLGDLAVNGSSIKGQNGEPALKSEIVMPVLLDSTGNQIDVSHPSEKGWRKLLLDNGPAAFAKAVRNHKRGLIMDTTWRDAHQSLLATRVRTIDLVNIAPYTSHALASAYSLEMWGGATFDVSMRFLHECPWDRLRRLRKLVPNIPFQMLLRGANGLCYSSLPDNVIYFFCEQAKKNGIDIFRVFDALNDVNNLSLGIDAAKRAGGVVEATMCYSGDMLNPKKKYNLDYYVNLVDKMVEMGIHILGIKDMAGVMKPKAARLLISAIREKHPELPIHVHTHDSAGTAVASMAAALEAGADVVDVATDSMSGLTSQPSFGAVLASVDGTDKQLEFDNNQLREIDSYWAQMRLLYSPFESEIKGTDSDVYNHEIPGGQLTNLKFQATSLGLGTQWAETKKAYIEANKLLGDIIKVTPTSKVVGDLAQFMVQNKLSAEDVENRATTLDFPASVLDFFQGLMGQPYGGFPEPLRTNVLKGRRQPLTDRPGKFLPAADFDAIRKLLSEKFGVSSDCDIAAYTQFPGVFEEYRQFVDRYGDLTTVPTKFFLSRPEMNEEMHVEIDQGKTLIVKFVALGPLNPRTGQREVYFELNGENRHVTVEDKKAAIETVTRPRADPGNPGHVAAPMSGTIVEIRVKEGAKVKKGDIIAVLSAMKMEIVISAPHSGVLKSLAVVQGDSVNGGDLCAVLEHE